ncbi:Serine/threonine-protein kinase CtkA [Anoxybacillus sp. P3H1B]|jgi:HIRAN domain/HipA-like C-terminal domain|uniref:HIRAN domain-containing protein n=1 Tax=Anoxybacillus sp. P3H1B TaxID=1769293 RepID=UPI00079A7EDF|nr:HIRAN domain-containing protein [Anoxybacillus sp. P3H1B]KXG09917.1 Serine/threonine-protein kinase CtkA [Anoxybacillus sp. P3H1B]
MTYPIIDVTKWLIDYTKGPGKGNREKEWILNPENLISGMFKIPRADRGEHWAEKLCSEIAKLIGFPCARVDLAIRNEVYGCLSYFFVDKDNGYVHHDGGTFFPFYYDDEKNRGYNIQLIMEVLKQQGIPFEQFLFIIIFDALVANGDRHQDNWGITRHDNRSEVFISPLYDNSACLGRDLTQERLIKYNSSEEQLLRYIYKGKSKIGWDEIRNENHFRLVRRLGKLYPSEIRQLIYQLRKLDDYSIENIVNKLPAEVISCEHKEFVKKFLKKRRDILIRIGENMNHKVENVLLIWKDPKTRRRFIVGRLSYNEPADTYKFSYDSPELEEALEHGFINFPNFPDLDMSYEIKGKLFQSIKNRLPNPKRPDFATILERYGLDISNSDMEILVATKGRLATDNFEFVKEINYAFGTPFSVTFDLAGARHCEFPQVSSQLKINDPIFLEAETDNLYDQNAVKVLTAQRVHIGYVPRYYSRHFINLINSNVDYIAKIAKLDVTNQSPDEWASIKVTVISS